MLPKDLGKISQYIVEKFTDIFYSVQQYYFLWCIFEFFII